MSGSEDKCSICSTSMKGQAFYTAECSHSFHFHCISSGNQFCPVCLVKWKQVPPANPIFPQFPPQQNSTSPFAAPSFPSYTPPQNSNSPFATPSFPSFTSPQYYNSPFAAVYNDDEALDLQSSGNKTSDTTTDGSSLKRLLMETYTEVPAVPRLTAVDDFTVLVHLKGSTVRQVNQNSRAPIDLVTVLETSGSMTGPKLKLLKRAMGFVIENLGE